MQNDAEKYTASTHTWTKLPTKRRRRGKKRGGDQTKGSRTHIPFQGYAPVHRAYAEQKLPPTSEAMLTCEFVAPHVLQKSPGSSYLPLLSLLGGFQKKNLRKDVPHIVPSLGNCACTLFGHSDGVSAGTYLFGTEKWSYPLACQPKIRYLST